MNSTPTTIVSLTEPGQKLAQKIAQFIEAEHLHRPAPFSALVQQRYLDGHRLILICATGIAVRTLAPVLKGKQIDPAVLVLDEQGQWIIPLLSGHEGGANEWGRQLAEQLSATLVCTTAGAYQKPKLILGIGCDRGCPLATIEQLVHETLAQHQLSVTDINAIASIDLKADEAGILEFSSRYQLPFHHFSAPALRTVEEQLSTRSDIVFREVGCYGVAEAAALLQAKQLTRNSAELIITKHKNQRATCAVARSYDL